MTLLCQVAPTVQPRNFLSENLFEQVEDYIRNDNKLTCSTIHKYILLFKSNSTLKCLLVGQYFYISFCGWKQSKERLLPPLVHALKSCNFLSVVH